MSAQTDRYERLFAWFVGLYPRRHREKYGHLMLQNLRDRLADAEELRDPHVTRDIFLAALLELPGSLFHEYVVAGREVETGRFGWVLFDVVFLAAVAWAYAYEASLAYGPDAGGLYLPLFFAVALCWATFAATRRLFLAFVMFLLEVASWMIGNILPVAMDWQGVNQAHPHWLSLAVSAGILLLPALAGYVLLAYYRANPKRFRRDPLRGLSASQVEEVREQMVRRRSRNWKVIGVLAAIFVGLNLAGLYDPASSHTDLDLHARLIPDAQNMYGDLAKLPGEEIGQQDPLSGMDGLVQAGIADEGWDSAKAEAYLQGTDAPRAAFLVAASKPYYQDTTMDNPAKYTTGAQAVAAPVPDLMGIRRTALLVLLHAQLAERSGDASTALSEAEAVAHVADAMAQNQGFLISELVAMRTRSQAVLEIGHLVAGGRLDSAQLASAQGGLATLHPAADGLALAEKSESYGLRLYLAGLRTASPDFSNDGATNFLMSLPARLPFTYQPNRTEAMLDDSVRQELTALGRPCDPSVAVSVPDQGPANFWQLFQFNGEGKFLVGVNARPYMAEQAPKACAADFQVRAVKAAVSLRQEEVVPSALNVDDPFGGKPVKYDPIGRTITSAGKGSPAASALQAPYDRLQIRF